MIPCMRLWTFLLLFPCLCFGEKAVYPETKLDEKEGIELPWLTGPLIAPSSITVAPGDLNVEPYFFIDANTGVYDSGWKKQSIPTDWNNYFQCPIQIGLTGWMDFQFSPTVLWNYTQHSAHWALGDLPVVIDLQLYRANPDNLIPNVKLVLRETIPIGKYKNLDPNAKGTDSGGLGSWNSGIGVVFGKLYHLYKVHYFSWRLFFQYNLPAPVQLRGFNVYGGGYGTRARLFPAQTFFADLGMEITLAQTWAFSLDLIGFFGGSTHYSGFSGKLPGNIPAPLGSPAFIQYSIAPGIEYNWNSQIGVIGGMWFTVAGRNATSFQTGVFAVNYYY